MGHAMIGPQRERLPQVHFRFAPAALKVIAVAKVAVNIRIARLQGESLAVQLGRLGKFGLAIPENGQAGIGVGPLRIHLQGFQVGSFGLIVLAALFQRAREGDLHVGGLPRIELRRRIRG